MYIITCDKSGEYLSSAIPGTRYGFTGTFELADVFKTYVQAKDVMNEKVNEVDFHIHIEKLIKGE